ncbi:DUF368 domain-containing protein [Flavobacteriaceae bacterium Ap0902]|nr:DUF368 domain-containing protein [Flavobacteriaceae bacterium Ap0902]
MYKRNFLDYLILYFKGLLMGTANKIPGVSGGMLAMVSGFYKEMIFSFQRVNINSLKLLLNGRFKKFFKYINFSFLFAINFGSVSAFFSISLLIDWLIRSPAENGLGFEIEVWSYFFGLIIGSVYYVSKKITHWSYKSYLGILLGAFIGLYISFMEPMAPNDNLWFIFICGLISVTGMTLPGFSGSFMLIIIGNYNLLLVDAVNNLFYTLIAVFQGDFELLGTTNAIEKAERIRMLYIVGIFATGSLFGMVSFSKLMGYLLRNFHNFVIALLMGFIIGSLGAAWPWKTEDFNAVGDLIGYTRYIPDVSSMWFIVQIICIIIGILTILIIDYYEHKNKFIH